MTQAIYNKKKVSLTYEEGVSFILTDKTGRRKIWNDTNLFHLLPAPQVSS